MDSGNASDQIRRRSALHLADYWSLVGQTSEHAGNRALVPIHDLGDAEERTIQGRERLERHESVQERCPGVLLVRRRWAHLISTGLFSPNGWAGCLVRRPESFVSSQICDSPAPIEGAGLSSGRAENAGPQVPDSTGGNQAGSAGASTSGWGSERVFGTVSSNCGRRFRYSTTESVDSTSPNLLSMS